MAVTTYAYRTRVPEIVAEWDAYQAEQATWFRKCKRLIGSWFPRQGRGPMVQRSSWGGNDRWVGISSKPWREEIKDDDLRAAGWRKDKDGTIVPFKKTTEGRAFAKLMAGCQPPQQIRTRLPGMPSHLFTGLKTYSPGVEKHGDSLIVTWAVELTDEDKIDRKIWKRMKLSELYRLREAEEAAAS